MSTTDKQIDGTHYVNMAIQPWELIAKNKLDYFEGAAAKYLLRWKEKDGVIDLDKAIHYLERIKELALQGHYGKKFKGLTQDKDYIYHPKFGKFRKIQYGKINKAIQQRKEKTNETCTKPNTRTSAKRKNPDLGKVPSNRRARNLRRSVQSGHEHEGFLKDSET